MKIIVPVTAMRETTDKDALRGKLESELVYGEAFLPEREDGEWVYGASAHDGYKGYVLKQHLGDLPAATHVVTAARSDAYRDATMKSPKRGTYSIGSRITVVETGEKFSRLHDGTWLHNRHILPADQTEGDIIDIARRFLETPYSWGGRSGFGVDCSGLVQVTLARAGIKAARDTADQETTIGEDIPHARSGDIVYFKGHVGIMADEDNIIHATAYHMKVVIEPLWKVEERGDAVTSRRRV
jgi:cell wall-associated NlpC family hydrolase